MTSPVWRPWTQHGTEPMPPEIVGADAATLFTRDGRSLLDMISSWWVITHRHHHPAIVQAIQQAAGQFDQICFAGLTHEPAERLAEALIEIAPAGLAHVFFSDTGSTSVEVALKMALGTFRNTGQTRNRIAVMQHGYHGDTVGCMSVGARGPFSAACEPLLFEVDTLPFPHPGDEAATLATFERLAARGDLAALLLEPLILGAGGMLMYDAEILAALRALATHYGVLLIADEVMTGWGRTGTLFACEQADITPDILCLSKGLTGGALPMAATLATEAVFEAHRAQERSRMLFHSSSFTANPIACAAALANIEIWRTEPVRDHIACLGGWHAQHLQRFAGDRRFVNARRLGAVGAVDLRVRDAGYLAEIAPALRQFFLDRDIFMRPLGNTIYVMPPYCATYAEIDRIYETIAEAGEHFIL